MRAGEAARLFALLGRIARGPGGAPLRDVEERRDLTIAGSRSSCDLYMPRKTTPDRAVVAVHGVTVNGARDPRLVHFSRCLARARVVCYVPMLAGLSECRFDERDVDDLRAIVAEAALRHDGAAGLIGFSYGASYALLAAARPEAAGAVSSVVGFGAYHSLADLLEGYRRDARRPAANDRELDDRRYLRLVLARAFGDAGAAPRCAPAALLAQLARFCHEATEEEKRRFDEGPQLAGLDVGAVLARALAERSSTIAALSPSEGGALSRIRCPVSLIHDAGDRVVPPEHSQRIHAELERGAARGRHRLLVTGLLSHVTLADAVRPRELLELFLALAPAVTG
jgi:pimeloyl-ACP methyl ester carboxylesterase